MTVLAEAIALRLGWDAARIDALRLGALLHDVGEARHLGARPGEAGAAGRARAARRAGAPAVGARLVGAVGGRVAALPYVLYHHERWDGGGYPDRARRRGDPARGPGARRRVRRDDVDPAIPAGSDGGASAGEIERCAGTQFDPTIAALFLEAWATGRLPVASSGVSQPAERPPRRGWPEPDPCSGIALV